ncbi:MAG TPA: hypothetical protein VGB95_06855 [Chitinophagales bacterium]
MKKAIKLFIIVATFAGLTTATSCSKTCNTGFEGHDCRTSWSEKFEGSYSFHDQCIIAGGLFGTATIAFSPNSDLTLLLTNFDAIGSSATLSGTLQDSATIYIPSGTAGGYTISNATGRYSNGVITWSSFGVAGSGVNDTCTSVWTKQ